MIARENLCPNWRELVGRRDRDPEAEGEWRLAIEHARGCESCREEVLSVDPLSLFALYSEPAGDAAAEAAEVAAMQQAVTTMRRHRGHGAPRRAGVAWRFAAAAVLLVAVGAVTIVSRPAGRAPAPEAAAVVEAIDAGMPPAFEQLDPPAARVYQLHEQGLSVVMIVDETLDV